MHCDTVREKIHDWLDQPGAPPMPPEIGEHIRSCYDCRGFISQWNAVELGLRSVRDQAPGVSPAFSQMVRARLQMETPLSPRRALFFRHRRLALAGAASLAVIMMACLAWFGIRNASRAMEIARRAPASSSPLARPAIPRQPLGSSPSISPEFPLANTSR